MGAYTDAEPGRRARRRDLQRLLTPAGGMYAFGGGGGTLTVASNLPGGNSLEIGNGGPGAVVLSGTNTYTGGTTVSSGTLTMLDAWSAPGGDL